MEFTIESGKTGFRIDDDDGGSIFTSVSKTILNLEDKERLIKQIILYNEGKVYKTKKAWLGRLNHTLFPAIEFLCINSLPNTHIGWTDLIRQAYASTLTTPYSKAKLQTRVINWNSNCRPFLVFMKDHDVIPLSVIIPCMKKVGELRTNSSFNVKLIGQKPPQKEVSLKTIDKVLTPIGLHRTDAQYLDEIRFDLERKRDKLLDCLKKYWMAIKSHYDFGKNVITNISETEPERLGIYERGDRFFTLMKPSKCGRKVAIRRHIADPETKGGVDMYLYLLDKNLNGLWKRGTSADSYLPCKEFSESDGLKFLPSHEIEVSSIITPVRRLGWCMGLLTVADVSYLVAILMMLNPKWNFESLLEAKTVDIDGKPHFTMSDLGMTFEVDKRRAGSMKKEVIEELSLEIISFLFEIRHKRSNLICKGKENYLFLTVNQKRDGLTSPSRSRVSIALSGYNSSKYQDGKEFITCLSNYFPSLNQFGLGPRTINHSKLRHTEAVLEWFRTGSISAVSRKLGNTKKVSMEHYIPAPLLASWSSRLVRRHQNLLIAAATMGEDYQLEAVDFSSLEELNIFLIGILSDRGNKSPLLQYLREFSVESNFEIPSEGSLNIALSEAVLTALYTYRNSAKQCHVDVEILSKIDSKLGISPLSFIHLANHLHATLPTKVESKLSKMHKAAVERANNLIEKVDWSGMFIKRGTYS